MWFLILLISSISCTTSENHGKQLKDDPGITEAQIKLENFTLHLENLAASSRILTALTIQNGLIDGSIDTDKLLAELLNIESIDLARFETFDKNTTDQFVQQLVSSQPALSPNDTAEVEITILMMDKWRKRYTELGDWLNTSSSANSFFDDVEKSLPSVNASFIDDIIEFTVKAETLLRLHNESDIVIGTKLRELAPLFDTIIGGRKRVKELADYLKIAKRLMLHPFMKSSEIRRFVALLDPVLANDEILNNLENTPTNLIMMFTNIRNLTPHAKLCGESMRIVGEVARSQMAAANFPNYTSGFLNGFADIEHLPTDVEAQNLKISLGFDSFEKLMDKTSLMYEQWMRLSGRLDDVRRADSVSSRLGALDNLTGLADYQSITKCIRKFSDVGTEFYSDVAEIFKTANLASPITLQSISDELLDVALFQKKYIGTLVKMRRIIDMSISEQELVRQARSIFDKVLKLSTKSMIEDLNAAKYRMEMIKRVVDTLTDGIVGKRETVENFTKLPETATVKTFFECLSTSQLADVASLVEIGRDIRAFTPQFPIYMKERTLAIQRSLKALKSLRSTSKGLFKGISVDPRLINTTELSKAFGDSLRAIYNSRKLIEKKVTLKTLIKESEKVVGEIENVVDVRKRGMLAEEWGNLEETKADLEMFWAEFERRIDSFDSRISPSSEFIGLQEMFTGFSFTEMVVDLRVERRIRVLDELGLEKMKELWEDVRSLDFEFSKFSKPISMINDTLEGLETLFATLKLDLSFSAARTNSASVSVPSDVSSDSRYLSYSAFLSDRGLYYIFSRLIAPTLFLMFLVGVTIAICFREMRKPPADVIDRLMPPPRPRRRYTPSRNSVFPSSQPSPHGSESTSETTVGLTRIETTGTHSRPRPHAGRELHPAKKAHFPLENSPRPLRYRSFPDRGPSPDRRGPSPARRGRSPARRAPHLRRAERTPTPPAGPFSTPYKRPDDCPLEDPYVPYANVSDDELEFIPPRLKVKRIGGKPAAVGWNYDCSQNERQRFYEFVYVNAWDTFPPFKLDEKNSALKYLQHMKIDPDKTLMRQWYDFLVIYPSMFECHYLPYEDRSQDNRLNYVFYTQPVTNNTQETWFHANIINYPLYSSVIVSQSPTDDLQTCEVDTRPAFWNMIVHYKCPHIVMTCSKTETGEYFPPTEESAHYGDWKVTVTQATELFDGKVQRREINVSKYSKGKTETHSLVHWRFVGWKVATGFTRPSRDVSPDKDAFLEPLLHVLQETRLTKDPICVHSKRGTGRAGVFVGCEYLFQTLMDPSNASPTLPAVLQSMRSQRFGLIDRGHQLFFLLLAGSHYFFVGSPFEELYRSTLYKNWECYDAYFNVDGDQDTHDKNSLARYTFRTPQKENLAFYPSRMDIHADVDLYGPPIDTLKKRALRREKGLLPESRGTDSDSSDGGEYTEKTAISETEFSEKSAKAGTPEDSDDNRKSHEKPKVPKKNVSAETETKKKEKVVGSQETNQQKAMLAKFEGAVGRVEDDPQYENLEVDVLKSVEKKAEEPTNKDKKIEEPQYEELKSEKPKVEEKKIGELKSEKPKVEEKKIEEPQYEELKSEKPKVEEKKIGELKSETSKVEEKKNQEPQYEDLKEEDAKEPKGGEKNGN